MLNGGEIILSDSFFQKKEMKSLKEKFVNLTKSLFLKNRNDTNMLFFIKPYIFTSSALENRENHINLTSQNHPQILPSQDNHC